MAFPGSISCHYFLATSLATFLTCIFRLHFLAAVSWLQFLGCICWVHFLFVFLYCIPQCTFLGCILTAPCLWSISRQHFLVDFFSHFPALFLSCISWLHIQAQFPGCIAWLHFLAAFSSFTFLLHFLAAFLPAAYCDTVFSTGKVVFLSNRYLLLIFVYMDDRWEMTVPVKSYCCTGIQKLGMILMVYMHQSIVYISWLYFLLVLLHWYS